MRTLTGKDASILAMLAQSNSIALTIKTWVLSTLRGDALRIARALLGMPSTKAAKKVAEAFEDWANNLGSGKEL